MEELKSRKEMNPAFMWDFTPIYPSYDAWEKALAQAETAIAGLSAVKGTLGKSVASMKAGLEAIFEVSAQVERVYEYAFLHKAGDNGDSAYQTMAGRATQLYIALSSAIAFLDPEILAMEEKTLQSYINDPALALYRHILEDTNRSRPHTLDAEREKMLAMLSDVADGPHDSFSMLESVDMTFPAIKDEQGREVALTHGNFSIYRESADMRVRHEAFAKYFGEFRRYIHTFAAMYTAAVKMNVYVAKVRGYSSACEAALSAGNVPISVYDSLIQAVHESLPTMQKYLELRRSVLGLEKLNMFDLYCPMVADVDMHVSFEEAKEMVKKATLPLGERYQKMLDEAYANHWMDVYENKGKTTGAFSAGVYGAHPYVLLNFAGKLDDAFTMAHELGHSMHSYLSNEAQAYCNHDYRIMVAEVASTVNEVLMTKYLLGIEKDKARRAYILNHFLEGFRTTVYRQTLFAEFERKAHEMVESGEPLTADNLNQVYHDLNALYYAGTECKELQDCEWARIPHFYRAFYVYQYATGFCSAVAIVNRILKTGDPSDYLRFLSTGGSDYPLEELKIAGVDLTKPDSVRSSLRVFADSLKELEELLK